MTFSEIEQVWIQAGGSKQSAPTAAAIALAESGGNPQALNDNASTGDYSVGLWQINYFGGLRKSRTAQFGPPSALTDPAANARAAVAVSSGGTNFDPWTTYTRGSYEQYLPGGGPTTPTTQSAGGLYQQPPRPSGNATLDFSLSGAAGAVTGWVGGVGDLPIVGGLVQGAKDATDAVKLIAWLFSPKHWAQVGELLVGLGLLGYGLVALGSGDKEGGGSGLDIPIPVVGKVAKAAPEALAAA